MGNAYSCGGISQGNESCRVLVFKKIANRYVIEKKLGKGGFGYVWLVKDTKGNDAKRVAKELQYLASLSTDIVKKFEQEAEITKNLCHKVSGIPHIYDYFIDQGMPVIIEEFIDGFNLDEYTETQIDDKMDCEGKLKWILNEILKILSVVHSSHLIHRDIKPSNIMIEHTMKKLYLIDFGIAKDIPPPVTSAKTVVGTPLFMAPEAWIGKTVYQSDIYSLGVTILYLSYCMQKIPITSLNLFANPTGEISNLKISEELKKILHKMVVTDLNARYKDCKEILDDLAST